MVASGPRRQPPKRPGRLAGALPASRGVARCGMLALRRPSGRPTRRRAHAITEAHGCPDNGRRSVGPDPGDDACGIGRDRSEPGARDVLLRVAGHRHHLYVEAHRSAPAVWPGRFGKGMGRGGTRSPPTWHVASTSRLPPGVVTSRMPERAGGATCRAVASILPDLLPSNRRYAIGSPGRLARAPARRPGRFYVVRVLRIVLRARVVELADTTPIGCVLPLGPGPVAGTWCSLSAKDRRAARMAPRATGAGSRRYASNRELRAGRGE
jgi:hypothetical protein